MKILIFIPARGGSKGIPGKNLIELNNKPLIKYTLDTVNHLKKHTEHEWIPFVSTDDEKIASYCAHHGMDMTYRRPKKLARDNSLIIDGIRDALKWLQNNKDLQPDAVLLLQPTTPIRNENSIIEAVRKIKNSDYFSIVSVTKIREHPYECIIINENKWCYLQKPTTKPSGRQDYKDKYYFIDGSFYFASTKFLITNNSFLKENHTIFHILDHKWPIDIDSYEDLFFCEYLLSSTL